MNLLLKFLIFLIPVSLVFSIFIADLIVVIFTLFFFYLVFLKKNFFLLQNDFFIFGIFLSIYFIFLSLISDSPTDSLRSSLFYFRFILFAITLNYLLKYFSDTSKILFYSFLTIYILIIIDSFIQITYNFNLLGYPYDGLHLKSFFKDEKVLGSYLIRTFPIFLGIYFIKTKKINLSKLSFLLALIFLLEIIILYTGERTAIALTFLFNLIFLIIISKYSKKIFIFMLLFTFVLISFLTTNENFKTNIVDRTINQLTINKINNNSLHFFSYEHEAHYITAFRMFQANKNFGIGPRMFRHKCDEPEYIFEINDNENGCSSHPHNLYIQILSETGIYTTGLLLFILYLVTSYIFQFTINNNINNYKNILFITCIFINIFPIIPYGNFFNNWLSILFYLPISFIINLKSFKFYNFIQKYINKNI